MAFTWFDKFDDAIAKIPSKEDQDALILALVRYGSTQEETELPYPLDAIFAGFKEDIYHSIKSRANGAKGGSKGGKKTPSNPASKLPKKTPSKTASTDALEAEAKANTIQSNTEQNNTIQSNTEQNNAMQSNEEQEKDRSPSLAFANECLRALNDTLLVCYSGMPEKCALTLERSSVKWSVDDVRAMVEFKRDEWHGTRYRNNLTPNCLFSPDHFEQYMHQSQQSRKEADLYAEYN